MKNSARMFLILGLIALGIVMRVLPHPANVAPITALALFSGAYLTKKYIFIVPLAAMVVSDALIGFHATIPYTWGSFVLIGVLGWQLQKKQSVLRIGGASLAGSVLFYLVTNFGVWASTPLYPKTLAGLGMSYTAAIPFFRNTLAGDLFYATMLFGLYALAAFTFRRRAAMPVSH